MQQYSIFSKVIHDLMAVVIITTIGLGYYFGSLDSQAPNYFSTILLHKSLGVSVLMLFLLRVLVLCLTSTPGLPVSMRKIERIMAMLTKNLLYVVMLLMPVSGYLMSNAAGRPVAWFGLQLPNVIAESQSLRGIFSELHEFLAVILILLIILHVAGAIKHRFIDGHKDYLKRMF